MKKLILVISVLAIMMTSSAMAVELTDISGHWAESYIKELTDKGVINGYEDGTYRPQGKVTKAQFLKLIMAASLPDNEWTAQSTKYDHWASIYIETAENYGVIEEGYIDELSAADTITRADVVEILGKCDIMIRNNAQKSAILELYDVSSMSSEQLQLLKHCVAREFINGYEDATFRPNNTLTRAEVAKIISVYMSK